ncbi:hypothetical protein [Sediminibacterium soli]|uniref:hypothetical protein n=1 Tax=Sediminibacterium soli TaxID=2698829 RepID=UPI00137B47BA|nr:hypothetical protein [Sediminibacterium soli]NCI46809.1 hypothetical protein [Sediminibacterium soli]
MRYGCLLVVPLILLVTAFTMTDAGSIYGRVIPYNAALHVWAVSDNDTGRAVIQNGMYEIRNLRPGRYRLIADGRYPYKVTTKPDVIVYDSSSTNAGEIILEKTPAGD